MTKIDQVIMDIRNTNNLTTDEKDIAICRIIDKRNKGLIWENTPNDPGIVSLFAWDSNPQQANGYWYKIQEAVWSNDWFKWNDKHSHMTREPYDK